MRAASLPGNAPLDGTLSIMNGLQRNSPALCRGISLVLWAACALVSARGASESRLLPCTTSWVGNSFGGGKEWVQQDIQAMVVADDGTIYTRGDRGLRDSRPGQRTSPSNARRTAPSNSVVASSFEM